MLVNAFFVLVLFCIQDTVYSVRLIEVRIPAHEKEGGKALLGCHFDLEGDSLYSVKWYKDEQEFFRYVPRNDPPIIYFRRPGIYVNKGRSSSTVVALENLTRESEGVYSCEVSGEAPNFTTVRSHKRINIHLLPKVSPIVTGLHDRYFPDELVIAKCTSPASRPKAYLTWLINGEPAPEHNLAGPWERIPEERPDAVETMLQLRFVVEQSHFINGAMVLECQATIDPLYQRITKSTHYMGIPYGMTERNFFFDFDEDDVSDSSHTHSSKGVLLFTVLLFYFIAVII